MSPFPAVFAQVGDFAANRAAIMALEANGFSLGPMQRGAPRAVMFGEYDISKWRNLSHDERREAHGTLTGDGRQGPLVFCLLPSAPDAAVAAAEAVRRAAEVAQ